MRDNLYSEFSRALLRREAAHTRAFASTSLASGGSTVLVLVTVFCLRTCTACSHIVLSLAVIVPTPPLLLVNPWHLKRLSRRAPVVASSKRRVLADRTYDYGRIKGAGFREHPF